MQRWRVFHLAGRLAVVALAVPLVPAAAQDLTDRPTFDLRGVVLDAANEVPVSGATVRVPELGLAAVTDSIGEFLIPDVPQGRFTFLTRSLGYFDHLEASVVQEGYGLVVWLNAAPFELEGLEVEVVDEFSLDFEALDRQFRTRMLRVGVQSQEITRDILFNTAAPTVIDVLQERHQLFFEPCIGQGEIGYARCVRVRGRQVRLSVIVDDIPVPSDFAVLDMYRPEEVYRIEIYPPIGQVRLTTLRYAYHMARMGWTPRPVCMMC